MIQMLLPIALVVFSNVFYNISAKFTLARANSFLSLSLTYLVAALLTFTAFCITGNPKELVKELSELNWTAVILGISIVGLEFGYLCMYRVGWKISIGSLVANISLACILLLIGVLVFKESISFRQIIRMAICLVGLMVITK